MMPLLKEQLNSINHNKKSNLMKLKDGKIRKILKKKKKILKNYKKQN
jgi:hypothetical protein